MRPARTTRRPSTSGSWRAARRNAAVSRQAHSRLPIAPTPIAPNNEPSPAAKRLPGHSKYAREEVEVQREQRREDPDDERAAASDQWSAGRAARVVAVDEVGAIGRRLRLHAAGQIEQPDVAELDRLALGLQADVALGEERAVLLDRPDPSRWRRRRRSTASGTRARRRRRSGGGSTRRRAPRPAPRSSPRRRTCATTNWCSAPSPSARSCRSRCRACRRSSSCDRRPGTAPRPRSASPAP